MATKVVSTYSLQRHYIGLYSWPSEPTSPNSDFLWSATGVSSHPSIVLPVSTVGLNCTFHRRLLGLFFILLRILSLSGSSKWVHLVIVLPLKLILILCLIHFLLIGLIVLGTSHIHLCIKYPVHLASFLSILLFFIFFNYFINLYHFLIFLCFINFLIIILFPF